MTVTTGNQAQGINNANGDGTGTGQGSGTGSNGDGNNAANNNQSGNAGDGGTGQNNGDGNASGNDGGGNGTDGGNQGSAGNATGFDGPYDEQRARVTIDALRAESKGKDKAIKDLTDSVSELKELIKGAGIKVDDANGTGNQPNTTSTDTGESAVLKELRELKENMAQEKLEQQFVALATGPAFNMQPSAVSMAWNTVKDNVSVVGGQATNLTDILGGLKATTPFMFAPVTNGQNAQGSTGSGTNMANNGVMPHADDVAAANAFGMKLEDYIKFKNGGKPEGVS